MAWMRYSSLALVKAHVEKCGWLRKIYRRDKFMKSSICIIRDLCMKISSHRLCKSFRLE